MEQIKSKLHVNGGGEDALFRTRTHWFVFGLWLFITVIFSTVLILEYPWESQMSYSQILIFSFVLIAWAVCAIETVWRIILFVTAEYAVMPEGIIRCRGIFLGKINEDINISDVVSVNLRSFDQEEDCGIVVIMTRDGRRHKLREIKSPGTFIDYIMSTETRQVTENVLQTRSNAIGTAGFVLALIAFILCVLPGINWFVCFFGLLLSFIGSFIGVFKRPRGLAYAGIVISLIDFIILMEVIAPIASIFA